MDTAPSVWWIVKQEFSRRWHSRLERAGIVLILCAVLFIAWGVMLADARGAFWGLGMAGWLVGFLIAGFVPVFSSSSWMLADLQLEQARRRNVWLADHGVVVDLSGRALARSPNVPTLPAPDIGIIISPSSVALGAACFGFAIAMMTASPLDPAPRRWIPAPFDWFWMTAVLFMIFASVHGGGKATLRVRRWASERAAETAASRLALARVELDGLQSRLNPSPLFAALDAIGTLSESDPARAERVVERLASFLRASLQRATHSFLSVEDERRFVEAFDALERERRAHRPGVTWIVEPDTLALRLPANSLFHIVEWMGDETGSDADATISISSGLSANRRELQIVVERQGVAIDRNVTLPPPLAALAERLRDGRIGPAGLTLERTTSGVRVRLHLPAARHLNWDQQVEGV